MKRLNFLIAFALYLCCAASLYAQEDSIDIEAPENHSISYVIYEHEKETKSENCETIKLPYFDKTGFHGLIYLHGRSGNKEVIVQKNNKWGIWDINQKKFVSKDKYDSIKTVHVVLKNGYSGRDYYNVFAALENKKWYLLDISFEKTDNIAYDSIVCALGKSANTLILYKNGKINLYHPLKKKIMYIEGDSFLHVKDNYPFQDNYFFYYKNGKINYYNVFFNENFNTNADNVECIFNFCVYFYSKYTYVQKIWTYTVNKKIYILIPGNKEQFLTPYDSIVPIGENTCWIGYKGNLFDIYLLADSMYLFENFIKKKDLNDWIITHYGNKYVINIDNISAKNKFIFFIFKNIKNQFLILYFQNFISPKGEKYFLAWTNELKNITNICKLGNYFGFLKVFFGRTNFNTYFHFQ